MDNTRSAGVLLHISSLPGKYGIGSLGKEAYRFAKRLARAGVRYWQILPLVQTGYGDSPYQSVSCSSGNPYFIDLDLLEEQGLLTKKELRPLRRKGDVDYGALYTERYQTLRTRYLRVRFFFDSAEFRAYVDEGTHEDYALFMTAKTVFGGSFCDWEEGIRRREPQALEKLRTDYHEEYLFWQFLQYEFDLQWKALKEYCNSLGIRIIGDIPLYVAYDSATSGRIPSSSSWTGSSACQSRRRPARLFLGDGAALGQSRVRLGSAQKRRLPVVARAPRTGTQDV